MDSENERDELEELEELEEAKEINSDTSIKWIQKMEKILEMVKKHGGRIGGFTVSRSQNLGCRLPWIEDMERERIAQDFCMMFERSRSIGRRR